jgi:hypothetical protein
MRSTRRITCTACGLVPRIRLFACLSLRSCSTMSASNSLGLELEVQKPPVTDQNPNDDWAAPAASTDWSATDTSDLSTPAPAPVSAEPASTLASVWAEPKGDGAEGGEKKPRAEPYVNPDRVWQTGGQKRVRAHLPKNLGKLTVYRKKYPRMRSPSGWPACVSRTRRSANASLYISSLRTFPHISDTRAHTGCQEG